MHTESEIFPYTLPVPTPDGEFLARYSPKGLCGLEFPTRPKARKTSRASAPPPRQVLGWHAATTNALRRALAGRAPRRLPPLDLSRGTDFQQAVWRRLCQIPCGQTRSYTQLAQAVGRPKALRAVGGACGANPIPVLVPCHRLLAANGSLGGFSAGLDWKRALLAREGMAARP
ncbi:MAG: methylated-DNA--[protein]-cysteine S-methyltransferase [Verrucomicrobiota bacterium]|jgi:O-6-methylguanine DNA methyltransferase